MKKVLMVFGTRPEAIKMFPIIKRLRESGVVDVKLCVTGQHRQMLDQMLALFNLHPDYDLNVMKPGQELGEMSSEIVSRIGLVYEKETPSLVIVHGDTTTAFAAALSAFYKRIPVGHVEAGLRTDDMFSPWPEEMNRRLIGKIASIHFAPTDRAKRNLINDGIAEKSIHVTGNSGIDALKIASNMLALQNESVFQLWLKKISENKKRRIVLVTCHRRENQGVTMVNICHGLKRLSARDDIEIVFPVHLSPSVRDTVYPILDGVSNIHLIEPLDYLDFVAAMEKCDLVLTDSGGVQEEAPTFGKPVLVLRESTERMEALEAGTIIVVGTVPDRILAESQKILDNDTIREEIASRENPYGNGTAAFQIEKALYQYFAL